jgi:hypothetical protein
MEMIFYGQRGMKKNEKMKSLVNHNHFVLPLAKTKKKCGAYAFVPCSLLLMLEC